MPALPLTITLLEPSSLTGFITVALKLVAIGIGTMLGALGLLKKSVDESGTLTRWGRWALAGVVLSGVVAVATQFFESYTAARGEKRVLEKLTESIQTQHKTLDEIDRSLYPFSEQTMFGCRMRIPVAQPALTAYGSLLRKKATEAHSRFVPLDANDALSVFQTPEAAGLRSAIESIQVDIAFRNDRDLDIRTESPQAKMRATPSWTLKTTIPRSSEGSVEPMSEVHYDAASDAIVLDCKNWRPTWLQRDTHFVSFLDFRSAHVGARVATGGYDVLAELDEVAFSDTSGRSMCLHGFRRLAPHTNVFVAVLPHDDEALWCAR